MMSVKRHLCLQIKTHEVHRNWSQPPMPSKLPKPRKLPKLEKQPEQRNLGEQQELPEDALKRPKAWQQEQVQEEVSHTHQ